MFYVDLGAKLSRCRSHPKFRSVAIQMAGIPGKIYNFFVRLLYSFICIFLCLYIDVTGVEKNHDIITLDSSVDSSYHDDEPLCERFLRKSPLDKGNLKE